jgi:RNA polymerase sigma factor (TIGR02999 family)
MPDVTRLLQSISAGEADAANRLLSFVYDELNRLAARELGGENPALSLCPTDLVHEAYLRLVGADGQLSFENRRHFFGAAARAIRQILIDAARRRGRVKRGGDRTRQELTDVTALEPDERLPALDEALSVLAVQDAVAAEVVNLHHFAGLSYDQTAELLGKSIYEIRQKWTFARAWLSRQIQ